MQSALKTENVQTIWSDFSIWLFYIYIKEILFRSESELLWDQPCCFTLHKWRVEIGWNVTCLILLPHMFFSHTNLSHGCAPFWQDLKQLMDTSVKLKFSHHLLVKWLAVCLLVLRKRQMCWKCTHCFILLQKEELKLTICVFWSLFWT